MFSAAAKKGLTCKDFVFKFPELAEQEILAWSESNPPKRFPTYIEYLEKVFPAYRISNVACYRVVLFGESRSNFECSGKCNTCLGQIMSEETASKMGIEPVAVRR